MKTKVTKIKYLFGLIIFSSALFVNFSIASAYSADSLVSATNSARAQNGLGALSTNSALASAAYAKAQDIIAKDYFAHNSPDGQTPWDFINNAGYSYSYAGENLAIGYTDSSELFSAWMNSPSHRENILNPNFREIGVAVLSGDYQGTQTLVAVQEFGATDGSPAQVASETATPAPENTPTPNNPSTPTPAPENQPAGFSFIKDKSNFTPKNIFAGEEITFTVTVTGELKSLEAQVFDQKYNLLETGQVTGTQEKTYTVKQKINQTGTSEIRVIGTDKNDKTEAISLGNVEAKTTVIAKEQTQVKTGLIAGIKESIKNHWETYTVLLAVLILLVISYMVFRKTRFEKVITSWRF